MTINLLDYLSFTPVSLILVALISFVSITIYGFSKTYLMGDSQKSKFTLKLFLLTMSAMLFALSDNYIVLVLSLLLSNIILAQMMVHKTDWLPAQQSGKIALTYFYMSFALLSLGFLILYLENKTISIRATTVPNLGLYVILVGALLQSAIWPFHRWLLSSLNAPTPVSALMHAGLINGGGIILIKLAPLYLLLPNILVILFLVGLISALVGSFWKLIQTNIKSMLACSTLAQMGFMFMQCGLGFFSAALVHVCFHGLFKAYLFLSSGSTLKENSKNETVTKLDFKIIVLSLLSGIAGMFAFILGSDRGFYPINSSCILLLVVWIVSTQLSFTILNHNNRRSIWLKYSQALFFSGISGLLYGLTVEVVESYVPQIAIEQPNNIFYLFGGVVLLLSWLIFVFRESSLIAGSTRLKSLYEKAYVKALNASQPNMSTITAQRNTYRY